MLYSLYQSHTDLISPVRWMARTAGDVLHPPWPSLPDIGVKRRMAAACQVLAAMGTTHTRPDFGIATVTVGNELAPVQEEAVYRTPFCTLLRFKKDVLASEPRVLVVAPMSGHFATLLRGTVKTLLPEHDVYITDWHNVRDVPLYHGRFDFDSYIDHLIGFIEFLGGDLHVIAVCQPSVPVLAAIAVMAEAGNRAQPRSMTLMAGPIDTRISPTRVNELAMSKPIDWFERMLISQVPLRFPGALRRVYPGFMQLSAFTNMNWERHAKAYHDLYDHLALGETEKAEAIRTFYDEYNAVMDLSAEFYLQTVRTVFQEHALPQDKLEWRGRRVNPAAIRRTALFTVEGEKDDICAVGQTLAAHDLCTGLRPHMKHHHLQANAGHYGVYNGRRWTNEIYPVLKTIIQANE
jgi:poly(3-hydroxybutyrate) depolymerase